MKFAKSIDYDDLRELLKSEPVTGIERQIAAKQNLNILQNETITYLQRELSAANIDKETAISILESEADELLAYCLAVIDDEEMTEDAEVEEYPEGEEPDENDIDCDNTVVLGIANGIALTRMCEFHCLKNRKYLDLLVFLKWGRIPFHKKYASQLKRVYKSVFC